MQILSACVKRFVRSTEDKVNEHTNKYINSSLYSIRFLIQQFTKLYLFSLVRQLKRYGQQNFFQSSQPFGCLLKTVQTIQYFKKFTNNKKI